MKKLNFWLKIIFSAVFVLVVDLTTKHFLFDVDYYNLIPNVLSVAGGVQNTGAAFGIFSENTATLISVSLLIIVALFVLNHFIKGKNTFYCLAFGFILGGAVGNLVDRVALGYVRDFVYLDFWPNYPTFNLADAFLVIGTIMLAIFILFMSEKKHEKKK